MFRIRIFSSMKEREPQKNLKTILHAEDPDPIFRKDKTRDEDPEFFSTDPDPDPGPTPDPT